MEVNFEAAISRMIRGIGETLQIPPQLLSGMMGNFETEYVRKDLRELKYYKELTSAFAIRDFQEYSSEMYKDNETFDACGWSERLIDIHNPMERYTNTLDEVEAFILYHDEIMKKAYMRAFLFFTYSELDAVLGKRKRTALLPDIHHSIRNDNDVERVFHELLRRLYPHNVSSIHSSILNTGMSPILYNRFWQKSYAYPNAKTNPFFLPIKRDNHFIGNVLVELIYDSFTAFDKFEAEYTDNIDWETYNTYDKLTLEE